jgi:O-antigen/teichoic acid export membrane protein
MLLAAFCLSLGSTVLFNVLYPVSYHSAEPVIPIIAESLAFYGIYTIMMVGANVRRKMWMASVFTTAAAVLNVGLNLYLIPHFGAMGAAYSTLIAYVALAFIAYFANQRIYPVPYEMGRLIFSVIAGVAIYYEIFALPQYLGSRWIFPLAGLGALLYASLLLLLARSPSSPSVQVRPAGVA